MEDSLTAVISYAFFLLLLSPVQQWLKQPFVSGRFCFVRMSLLNSSYITMSTENVFFKWAKWVSPKQRITKKELGSKPKYWLKQQPNWPHHADRHNTIQRDRRPKDSHREKQTKSLTSLPQRQNNEGQPKGASRKKTSAPYVQGQCTPNLIWSQALADPDKSLHKPKSTPP